MNIEINQYIAFPDYKCKVKIKIYYIENRKLFSSILIYEHDCNISSPKIRINTNSNNFILMFSFYPSIEALDDNGEVEESYMDEYQDMLHLVVHAGKSYCITEDCYYSELQNMSIKSIIRKYVNSQLDSSFTNIIKKSFQINHLEGVYIGNENMMISFGGLEWQ